MTRRRLLDAAIEQFAAHGFSGARVDVIGRRAGVNKERIYQYFGDKAGLFDAVLESEVEGLLSGVTLDGRGPEAAAAFASALFDRTVERPHLARLLAWESLELDRPVSAATRAAGCRAIVTALADAVPMTELDAAQLVLSIVAIATVDRCLPHLAALIVGAESTAARRSAVRAQALALAGSAASAT